MNKIVRRHQLPSGQSLYIVHGDLTVEEVDAIVNAANEYLRHGGGVAGAIVQRGGPLIQSKSDEWVHRHGPVSHEKPAYTTAGKLPCRYVIHAVGPVWGSGDEDNKLSAAVRGSLELAEKLGVKSIAFPAISTGIFGFPKARAAEITIDTILRYYKDNQDSLVNQVRLTLFDQPTLDKFLKVWEEMELDDRT